MRPSARRAARRRSQRGWSRPHLEVGDVMTGRLVTAYEEEDLAPVLRRMRTLDVRRLPIVDAEGSLTGVLSVDDVIPALSSEMADLAALVSHQAHRESDRRP